jgi:hypothetical protein
MEFLSNEDYSELSVRSTPPYGKLYFYEQILQVPTYVTYDPYEPKLEVRYLQNGAYETQAADAEGRVRIPELDLWLGIWSGERLGQTINWLRWWDSQGNLLLWSSEQAQQERLQGPTGTPAGGFIGGKVARVGCRSRSAGVKGRDVR